MIKAKISIEIVKNERLYQLICDNGAPLGELYDVLNNMRGIVIQRANEDEADRKSAEEKKSEEET